MQTIYSRIIVLLTLFSGLLASAQPTLTTGLTLEEYVNDILLGTGVTAFNIQLTGDPAQIGYLQNAGSTLFPIDGGIVLSTGAAGQMACQNDFAFFPSNPNFGDLLTVANSVPPLIGQNFSVSQVNDVCILEFDFVATGDSLKFDYVFGSDEYDFYINTQFNDVFAFFISGPGITGPYSSPPGFPNGARNIAFLPGSSPPLPITISSVHSGQDNGLANIPPLNEEFHITNLGPDGFILIDPNICVNGFTIPITAEELLICGETYHIALAIADGFDQQLTSWVVLREGSFESNSVVQVDLSIDVGAEGAITLYEDCGTATLTFTRPENTNIDLEEMVVISYQGVGINGVDYTLLPDTIVFPVGVSSVAFELIAIPDGIPEGAEEVVFEILNLAACSGTPLTSYFSFVIQDTADPLVVQGYTTEICDGAEVELAPIISGGYGNFSYQWSTGAQTSSVVVGPNNSTMYNVIVSDTCGMPSDDGDITVNVLFFPQLQANITQGNLTLDCNESVFLTASASGGDGNYTYSWTDENGMSLGGGNSTSLFYGTWQGADEIVFTVTDGCGLQASDVITVTLNVPPIIITVPTEVTALCQEQFTISPTVSGGQAPYNFNWTAGNQFLGWQQNLTASSSGNQTYTLTVSDGCGQDESVNINLTIQSPPVTINLPTFVTGPCTEVFNLSPVLDGGSGGFQYTWTVNGAPFATTANINFQSFDDAVVQLSVVDQCGATDAFALDVFIVNPPLIVDLGEDLFASCLDNTEIDVEIVSGAGGYEYEWFVDGVSVGTDPTAEVQSFFTVPVLVSVTDGCGGAASDELIYNIPDIPLTLTLSADTAICAGDAITISALATGGEEGFFYEWNSLGAFGPNQFIAPYESAVYPITATDICGKTISGDVFVEVQYLFSNFTVSATETENQYQFFGAPSPECDECIYAWDFGDGSASDEANPLHTFDGLSDYQVSLQVTNAIGCTDIAYTLINGPVLLYIPNAFTPNNDGINDVFRITGSSIQRFEIIIFNRWGEKVYESTDINQVWDGSHEGGNYYVPNDIYQYVVKVKGFDTDAFERSGTVSVMR
ncbi:MAG: choice-of-anchor L domain-containing protein [Flavobacteriales bacterium]